MPPAPFKVARIVDLERPGGWSPIRRHLGIRSFGVNAWTGRDGGETIIPAHDELPAGHEELYVVVSGRAAFTVDGTETDAPAGTIVYVPDPASSRSAVATEAGTTVLSVGGVPGEAFAPRAWETNADAFALLERGEHEEARRLLTDALDVYQDKGGLLYNLACAEALMGERERALEHLREALAATPALAEHARGDGDLAALRDDPSFAEIVGG